MSKILQACFNSEGRNFMFVDGHVEWWKREKIPLNNSAGDNYDFWGDLNAEN